MWVGYARNSPQGDELAPQLEMLKQAGCQRIFTDEIRDHKFEQPGLTAALNSMRPADTLVIWRLDRLGRSLKEVIQRVEELQRQAIGVRSLQEEIDTSSPDDLHQMRVFSALAACERNLLRERTKVGLAAARARGRKGGRPKGLSQQAQQTASLAEQLYVEGELSIQEICAQLEISKPTFYNYLRFRGVSIGKRHYA